MTRSGVLLGLLFTFAFTPVGLAQGPRERAWADELGKALESPARVVERVRTTLEVQAPDGAVRAHEVRGVRAELGGLVVRRLQLESVESARDLFARYDHPGPIVGELRGAQLVYVEGELVRDPALARRALDAAWLGLPSDVPAPEGAYANLAADGLVLRVDASVEAVVRPIRDAISKAVAAEPTPSMTVQAGPHEVEVTFSSGFTARMHAGEDVAWARWVDGPEKRAALDRYAEVFFARDASQAAPQTGPRRGLQDVLSGALEASPGRLGSAVENTRGSPRGLGGLDGEAALEAASGAVKNALRSTLGQGRGQRSLGAGPADRPLGE